MNEYVEDLGSPSSSFIITLKFPKSVPQFVGLILISVFEIREIKDGAD